MIPKGSADFSPAKNRIWWHFDERAMRNTYGQGVSLLCHGRQIAEVEQRLEATRVQLGSPVDPQKLIWSACSHVPFKGTRYKRDLEGDEQITFVFDSHHYPADDAADAGSGDARPEPSAASSSSGAAALVSSVETPQRFAEPSQDDISKYTEMYTRPGREGHFRLPEPVHVVVGARNSKRKQYFAYCQVCKLWMNWPPGGSNTVECFPPCKCVAGHIEVSGVGERS